MAAIAVLSVIFAGGKTAWEMRGEPLRAVALSLVKLTLVIGAATATIALAVQIADGFAAAIIDRSVENGDFGANILRLLGIGGALGGLGAFLVIVMGLFALFASVVQIALMAARSGLLVILTGTMQLSAAATNTEIGSTWFKRSMAWLIAFVLYKPAAAVVYATAFRLSSSDVFAGGGLISAVCGVVLMFLALFALPALMRFTTPLVGAMADRGGGGGLGSAAAVALPTGAMALPRGGADGSSGSNGAMGDSGATGAVGVTGARGGAGAQGDGGSSGCNGNGCGPPSNGAGAGQPAGAPAAAPAGASQGAGGSAAGAGQAAAARGGASAAAGAAGGPAGAAAAAAMQAGGAVKSGAQQAAQSQSDDGGPYGSA
jgi:hypothetical protein